MGRIRRRFWLMIHNAVAHPLLCVGARWSHRFHDWTAEAMMSGTDAAPDRSYNIVIPNRLHVGQHVEFVTETGYRGYGEILCVRATATVHSAFGDRVVDLHCHIRSETDGRTGWFESNRITPKEYTIHA